MLQLVYWSSNLIPLLQNRNESLSPIFSAETPVLSVRFHSNPVSNKSILFGVSYSANISFEFDSFLLWCLFFCLTHTFFRQRLPPWLDSVISAAFRHLCLHAFLFGAFSALPRLAFMLLSSCHLFVSLISFLLSGGKNIFPPMNRECALFSIPTAARGNTLPNVLPHTAWRYIDFDSLEWPELWPIYTCTMILGEH